MSKLRVKFLIDKEQKRVVYAEAGSDFVDVLLSFLTLPLGRIVRLLGKQSGLGSLDSLYHSVELLDEKYLRLAACKEMLLNPRSAAALICEDLKIKNIHDPNPRAYYFCKCCSSQNPLYYTFLENVECSRCGKLMTEKALLPKDTSQQGGIFVRESIDFWVTDNLRVMPVSLFGGLFILIEMGIKDASMLEERVIDFGTEEALKLLRKALVCKNPLTEVCFPDACVQASVNCSFSVKEKLNVDEKVSETTLKLILNKMQNKVIYAEAGEHFVNQLLSFLTFPLGSVLKLLSHNVSELSGCLSNLYSSVENMSLDCFKSENCRNMLLTPKLAAFYEFEQQILNLEEISSLKLTVKKSCEYCHPSQISDCWHPYRYSELVEHNHQSVNAVIYNRGAYVSKPRSLIVADNLRVSPHFADNPCVSPHDSLLSFISTINNNMNLDVSDIVGKNVCFDKTKALLLLSAMLISDTVLTDIFCPKQISVLWF